MPEAEEGNRTEDGKIVQVRSNVACANKWSKCGQMTRRKKCCLCGQRLQILTNAACSENGCKSHGRRKGTHTHTHTLSSPRSRKGCLRKRGTRSRRCVHNNTQRHNNTDAESHSPNLIHRTEILMSRARIAEGVPAGCATLRHNRTHAPTIPRKARTYMRI